MITQVTGKNQVTVPARIAAKEGIHAGTRLDWQPADEEHVLIVHVLPDRATLATQLRGRGKRRRRKRSSAVANLIGEREREDRGRG